jgi:hypothetical protein
VMVRHQAALASGKLTRVTSGVNLPPSEVIMSSLPGTPWSHLLKFNSPNESTMKNGNFIRRIVS